MEDAFADGMTTPASYEDSPLPKKNGHRGLLPSTWVGRSVRIEYTDASGSPVRTTGVLQDFFAFGPAFHLAGGKVLLAWDRLVMMELVND